MVKNRSKFVVFLLTLILCMTITDSFVAFAKADDDIDIDINLSLDEKGLVRLNKNQANQSGKSWRVFINRYKGFVIGIAGVGAVSMVLIFIFNFMKLGAVAGNPQERKEAVRGLMTTGIAAALLGAVSLVTFIFYNALN